MRILSLGTDSTIFDPRSRSAERMRSYGEMAERYDIMALSKGDQGDFDLSPKARVFAVARNPLAFFWNVFAAMRRAKKIAGKYDLITAENPFEIGLAVWLGARLVGAAFHLQVHGDFYGSRQWRLEKPINRFKFLLAKLLARRADGVRVVSERIKQSLIALGVPAEKITVAPIASDIVEAAAGIPNARFAKPTVLYIGRFEKEKNPLLLIEAFARVRKKIPDAELRLIGEGSLESAVRARIRDFGLDDAVKLLPWQSDLAAEYSRSWVLAIPSDHEGWGRVAAEAGAFGLPVVMTDVGCAGELVKDGETGWVVPVRDVSKMSEALVEALENSEEAKRRAMALGEGVKMLKPLVQTEKTALSWDETLASWEKTARPALRATRRLLIIAALAHAVMFLIFLFRFGVGGEWGWYVLKRDDIGYLRLARNLWAGVFSQSINAPFSPDSDRMPIYPLFLATLKFLPAWIVIFTQQIISIAAVLIWYRLVKRLVSEKIAWWSAALFAVEPTIRFWTAQFTTEALFGVFWFGALLFFSRLIFERPRLKDAVWCGTLLALSVLTRPIALYYPAVLALTLIFIQRRSLIKALRLSFVMIAVFSLALSPWILRNSLTFGMPAVSFKGSGIMFGENAPTYLMWKKGISREAAMAMLFHKLPSKNFTLPYDNPALDRVVKDLFREDPLGFSFVMIKSSIPFFLGDGYSYLAATIFPRFKPVTVRWDGNFAGYVRKVLGEGSGLGLLVYSVGKIITVSVVAFAILGLAVVFRKKEMRSWALWLALTLLYFAATSGTIAYSRYRYPIQPILFLFAIMGAVALWRFFQRNRRSIEKV